MILDDEMQERFRDLCDACAEFVNAFTEKAAEAMEILADAITDTCGCWSPNCNNCPMKYKDTTPQCDIIAWLKQEVSDERNT